MVCVLVWAMACVSAAAQTGVPKQWLDKAAATQWFAAHANGASFVSHGGDRQGGDADAMIDFTQGGQVEMTEFGAAVVSYKGTYEIGDAGEITLHLEGYSLQWPVMHLHATAREAWLTRTDGKTGFSLAGGDYKTSGTPFWPFKWRRKGA
jgi:hypothetical protein